MKCTLLLLLLWNDVLVNRSGHDIMGYHIYLKSTHSHCYLHEPWSTKTRISRNYPTARHSSETQCQSEKLKHLQKPFQTNRYSNGAEMKRTLQPYRRIMNINQETMQISGYASKSYLRNNTNLIDHLLTRHSIEISFKPTQIRNMLRSAEDSQETFSQSGVCRLPCPSGLFYVGTAERSTKTRISEYKRWCWLDQAEKSAVAEHEFKTTMQVTPPKFDDTVDFSIMWNYYQRLYREVIEIHKHRNNS